MTFIYIFHSFGKRSWTFCPGIFRFFYKSLEILYFPDTGLSQLPPILISVQKEDSGCSVWSCCGRRASPKNSPVSPAGSYTTFFLLSFPNAGFSPFGNFFILYAKNRNRYPFSCSACAPLSLMSQGMLGKFAKKEYLFLRFWQSYVPYVSRDTRQIRRERIPVPMFLAILYRNIFKNS